VLGVVNGWNRVVDDNDEKTVFATAVYEYEKQVTAELSFLRRRPRRRRRCLIIGRTLYLVSMIGPRRSRTPPRPLRSPDNVAGARLRFSHDGPTDPRALPGSVDRHVMHRPAELRRTERSELGSS
jgi:hypothetical protein